MARTTTTTGGRAATTGVIPGKWALSVGRPDIPAPAGFEWTPLSDMARLESGHTPSRRHAEYWDGNVPWIGIKDATGNHGRVITSTLQTVTQAGLDNSSARLLPAGTVCLSRTASVGYVVTMGVPMATSQDFVNWVCGPRISSRYLHYLLVMEQESVRRFAHGTTHQTVYYPEAKAFHVCIPSRDVQDRIVSALSSLDNKIAVNDRIQDTADELIRRLYAAAQAEPDAREHPLLDALRVTFGAPFASSEFSDEGTGRPLLRIRDLKTFNPQVWTTQHLEKELVVNPGDVVAGMDAEFRPTFWLGDAAVMNQRVLHAASRVGGGSALAREALRAPLAKVEGYKTGTTVAHLNKSDLSTLVVHVPSEGATSRFQSAAEPLRQRLVAAAMESRVLAALRNTLLPQLMSGRLRVRDAETIVEDHG
ncbi:restriction endonuclease subunit S [Streptomyces sp. NPDC091278]|uniref:restriction endonuclease subunit S n=1 Tax=Streptomyces sp. NPDC091278 TaxID=3155301 RepID=UPI00344E361C